jgi:hypothetical protein
VWSFNAFCSLTDAVTTQPDVIHATMCLRFDLAQPRKLPNGTPLASPVKTAATFRGVSASTRNADSSETSASGVWHGRKYSSVIRTPRLPQASSLSPHYPTSSTGLPRFSSTHEAALRDVITRAISLYHYVASSDTCDGRYQICDTEV